MLLLATYLFASLAAVAAQQEDEPPQGWTQVPWTVPVNCTAKCPPNLNEIGAACYNVKVGSKASSVEKTCDLLCEIGRDGLTSLKEGEECSTCIYQADPYQHDGLHKMAAHVCRGSSAGVFEGIAQNTTYIPVITPSSEVPITDTIPSLAPPAILHDNGATIPSVAASAILLALAGMAL